MVEGVEGNWPVGTTSVREAVTQSSTPQGSNRYIFAQQGEDHSWNGYHHTELRETQHTMMSPVKNNLFFL